MPVPVASTHHVVALGDVHQEKVSQHALRQHHLDGSKRPPLCLVVRGVVHDAVLAVLLCHLKPAGYECHARAKSRCVRSSTAERMRHLVVTNYHV